MNHLFLFFKRNDSLKNNLNSKAQHVGRNDSLATNLLDSHETYGIKNSKKTDERTKNTELTRSVLEHKLSTTLVLERPAYSVSNSSLTHKKGAGEREKAGRIE
jgi:hypothetical protein